MLSVSIPFRRESGRFNDVDCRPLTEACAPEELRSCGMRLLVDRCDCECAALAEVEGEDDRGCETQSSERLSSHSALILRVCEVVETVLLFVATAGCCGV